VLELGLAAGTVAGMWVGGTRVAALANGYMVEKEAVAATVAPHQAAVPVAMPRAELESAAPAARKTIFPDSDGALLAPLHGPVTRVKLNRGGTSLSLRLDFATGARASFKPEQTWAQSDPRREIAAYRIDRMLGIGHVAPVKEIEIPVAELVAAADPGTRASVIERLEKEAISHHGVFRGEVQWWIPAIKEAKVGKFRVDEPEGLALWTSYLEVGATMPDELRPLLEQLATCAVFDIVIDNADRWTGNNTQVSPDAPVLYFMDNTMSFSTKTVGHEGNLLPLRRMQVFPRRLVERLRALTVESLTAVLADDSGLAPLLSPEEIRAIILRRDHLLEVIDELIAKYGEAAVLALP
jgi:hypothetical protein